MKVVCTCTRMSGYAIVSSWRLHDLHAYISYAIWFFSCGCTHTHVMLWCYCIYAVLRLYTYVTLWHWTFACACAILRMWMTLRYCTFSCICTRTHPMLCFDGFSWSFLYTHPLHLENSGSIWRRYLKEFLEIIHFPSPYWLIFIVGLMFRRA